MGEMGKGEMGTAHAGKPPSLPRELRTPLGLIVLISNHAKISFPCNSSVTAGRNDVLFSGMIEDMM
jgi:hypothetical protein